MQVQCPVCGDVPEDPVVAKCGHVYCQQCMAGQLEGTGGRSLALTSLMRNDMLLCVLWVVVLPAVCGRVQVWACVYEVSAGTVACACVRPCALCAAVYLWQDM